MRSDRLNYAAELPHRGHITLPLLIISTGFIHAHTTVKMYNYCGIQAIYALNLCT